MRPIWARIDDLCDRTIRKCSEFFAANARLLGLTIAAGIFAYGYELTHLTFSIDEEVMWQTPDGRDVWLGQRRWGMYLIQTFLLPDAIYPFTSAALAIIFLSLASVLLVHRAEVPRSAKAIFCVLFISFPTFAHIQYFEYMGAYVALAILLVVAGERLVALAHATSLLFLVPAILALTVATACHQSLLFVFPTLVLITLATDALRNELSYQTALRRIGLASVTIVGAVLAFYAVSFACGLQSNGYVEGFLRWGSSSPQRILSELFTAAAPFLMGTPMTYATVPTALVPALALLALGTRVKSPALTCAMVVLLTLSPLAVHLVFGTWMSSRSMMAVPFAFAGLWYLLFSVSAPVVRVGIIAFTAFCLILNSSLISRVSLAQELTYKADALVASRILDRIYDARPRLAEDATPLAFVGMLDPPRSKLFTKDEVFGGSFWQWDGGNPYRMYLFLQSLGLPTTVAIAPRTEWPRAKALAESMPTWPDKDCVQWRDGLVIVKLSDVKSRSP